MTTTTSIEEMSARLNEARATIERLQRREALLAGDPAAAPMGWVFWAPRGWMKRESGFVVVVYLNDDNATHKRWDYTISFGPVFVRREVRAAYHPRDAMEAAGAALAALRGEEE